ncbi:hypothetical protein PUN28_003549 [Cardiocondyla obscurior]|uniref:Uncharacterized protein n=1 Tax=Cardiocondyla obscurior TaxID=286306 RepID=A0AAW2GK20_9HYME
MHNLLDSLILFTLHFFQVNCKWKYKDNRIIRSSRVKLLNCYSSNHINYDSAQLTRIDLRPAFSQEMSRARMRVRGCARVFLLSTYAKLIYHARGEIRLASCLYSAGRKKKRERERERMQFWNLII